MSDVAIRLVDVSDAAKLAELLLDGRQHYAQWLPSRPDSAYTVEGQTAGITSLLAAHKQGTAWPGVMTVTGQVVGQVSISSILLGPFGKGFLGYWIGPQYQNRGYTSRAVGLVLDVARETLRLHRVEAHTQLDNVSSQAVLRRHGFQSWGIAHNHFFAAGKWRDEVFWELELGAYHPPQTN